MWDTRKSLYTFQTAVPCAPTMRAGAATDAGTEFVDPSKEILDAFVKARGVHQLPVAFMKADFDIEKFVDRFNSNHISGVAGHYKKELINLCSLLDIEPVVIQ